MNMKTLGTLLTSALFSFGAASAVAFDWGTGGEETTQTPEFTVVDKNEDGAIDLNEAKTAGISSSRFESMDTNGDGFVVKAEYES